MSEGYAGGDMAAAARVWAGFPVDAEPRPYVLVQERVGEAGYRTVEAKEAFMHGRIRFAPEVPDAAVDALVAGGVQLSPGEPALLIWGAALGRHAFRTDRGVCARFRHGACNWRNPLAW